MSKIKQFFIKKETIIYALIIVFICLISSLSAGHYVDFEPINGTFQNFNPVRRLLNGHIPYKDFVDYLGLGHLFLGTFFTFIFGGDYQASLIAFNFLSMLSTIMISYLISYAIFMNKKESILITSLFIMLLLVNPMFFRNYLLIDSQISNSLSYFSTAGNSARFIRGMILPIFIILFSYLYNKINSLKLSFKKKNIIFLIGTSFISALSFIWSNDYGISVWICTIILYFFIELKRTKKIFKSMLFTLLEILLSFIFVFIFVSILTLGNFVEWLEATFQTGGYQSWYYNSTKSFYLFDIDISFYQTLQILISLYYFFLYFKNKDEKKDLKYLVLGFANMTAFCAINEYKLLSGGDNYEYGTTILYLTIMYELINYIKLIVFKKKYIFTKAFIIILLIIESSWFISRLQQEFKFEVGYKYGTYIEELGGNNTKFGKELLNTKKFLDNKKIFSTYSSAMEVMTNQFQPTKYDYIIHALGDNARKEYLNEFNKGNFDYVSTIQRYYTHWEHGWISRANWYFYRELYNNYHPVYGNTYQLYWEDNLGNEKNYITNDDYNIDVSLRWVDINTVVISVNTDETINGYADFYIDYKVEKNNRFISKLIFNKMLYVENYDNFEKVTGYDFDCNYLKDKSKEYIPVKIINGKGSVRLTSYPLESTSLIVNNISCNKIFTVLYDYVEIDSVKEENGEVVLLIDKNMTTSAAVTNAKKIVINGQDIVIKKIKEDDKISLVLKTKMKKEDIQTIMMRNNNFKIIK